jgi:hypothetical protein
MIDVNKITSTLAKLPDQQLQQYAAMHKNDPYTMALAMAESNRRKELRAAGQGAQGMQEQPKIVDQMVAEMAPQQMPEELGIGQLPAGEMGFAGGGIVAFADGGDVERFNGSQSQFVQDAAGIPQAWDDWKARLREEDARRAESDRRMAEAKRQRLEAQQKTSFANYLFGSPEREAEGKAELAQLSTTPVGTPARSGSMPEQGYTRPGMLYDPRLNTPASAPLSASGAAPSADTTRRPAPATGAAPRPVAADTGPQSIETLQQKYFGSMDQETGSLRNQRAGLAAGIKDLAEQNLADTEAAIAARGDVYKGREGRLAEREKGLAGMDKKNQGLALLQAGAAMMSTRGGLAVALGKGIEVGSERYVSGLDKINAAQEKFAEARDRLEDLRINRDDMNAKDVRQAKREAREAELRGKELFYNGAVQDLGIKQKNLTAVFGAAANALNTDREIAGRKDIAGMQERGANARATQMPKEMQTAMMLGTGNTDKEKLESGLRRLQEVQAGKFNVSSSYADYLKAFAGKDTMTPPLSFANYAAQFGAVLPR